MQCQKSTHQKSTIATSPAVGDAAIHFANTTMALSHVLYRVWVSLS